MIDRVEVKLATLVGSWPAETMGLRRRLENCLASKLKEIAQQFKLQRTRSSLDRMVS